MRGLIRWFDLHPRLSVALAIGLSLSGIELARPPGWIDGAAVIAYVPLILLLGWPRVSWQTVALAWGATTGLSWLRWTWPLAYYPHEAMALPWSVSVGLLLVNATWCALPYAIGSGVGAWLVRRQRPQLGTFLALLLLSLLPVVWWQVFPAGLHVALVEMPGLRAGAAWAGHYGLAVIMLVLNFGGAALLTRLCQRHAPRPPLFGVQLGAAGVIVILCTAWEVYAHARPPGATPGNTVRLGLIQPALPPWRVDRARVPFPADYQPGDLHLIPLSREALAAAPDIDLLVWPEIPDPVYFESFSEAAFTIRDFATEVGVPILFCATEKGATPEAPARQVAHLIIPTPPATAFNLRSPPALRVQSRAKKQLIPFSEYLPGERGFPLLRQWFPRVNDFAPGENFRPLTGPDGQLQIAPLVCYDDLFPPVGQRYRDHPPGANLLVTLSNDVWFGDTHIQDLRVALGLVHAMQVGLPWVRVGNGGPTLWATADGQLKPEGAPPRFTRGFVIVEVPFKAE